MEKQQGMWNCGLKIQFEDVNTCIGWDLEHTG